MPQFISVVSETWGQTTIYNPSEKSLENLPLEPESLQLSLTKIEEIDKDLNESKITPAEEIKDEKSTEVPYLSSCLFGTILEDTITQLRILMDCNFGLRIIKTKSDWEELLRDKFSVAKLVCEDELAKINVNNIGCDQYKIAKLDVDRNYITDVMVRTYVELCLNRSFKPLQDAITALLNLNTYREALFEEEAKNRTLYRDLNRQLRHQRNHFKTVNYDTEIKYEDLKTEVEDSTLVTACKGRYVESWQGSRIEQHAATIRGYESVYTNSIEYYRQRFEKEHRIHMEIEKLTNYVTHETLAKVEQQMDKYDRDMEDIDLKIQLKQMEYHNMRENRTKLDALYAKHAKECEDWINFKTERERAEKYVRDMTNAANAVQAWWRGLLVRLSLGPYKPEIKPKKNSTPKKK